MKLLVIITGLVLLVPDKDRGQLHLLFPMADLREPGMEHHLPHIRYRTGAGQESVLLEGWRLDLTSIAGAGEADDDLPEEVIPLGNVFARGVPRPWVSGSPSWEVVGHVTLPWPEEIESQGNASWLLVAGRSVGEVTLTNEVKLTYDNFPSQGGSWMLQSLPSGAGGSQNLTPWRPGTGEETIRISNVPDGGGEELLPGEEGVHFQAYVDLLRLPGEHERQRPRVYLNEHGAGSPFNCMIGWSPIKP